MLNYLKKLFHYRLTNPDQERIDSELRVARQIQFSLVPDNFPTFSEWREFDLCALLNPAREVGGDYYDFFLLDSDRMALAVGDVSGTGVPAALYMAVCRTAFRSLARDTQNPGELLTRLNDLLVRDHLSSGLYITIACFFVDLPSGRCEYSLAGHPAPLLHRRLEGLAEFVDSPRETFIGMKPGVTFPTGELRMGRGDTLLLYSDGVTEARNPAGEELAYQGLLDFFLRAVDRDNCREIIDTMENSLRGYSGLREQLDDTTLLIFRHWGPGGQKLMRQRTRATRSPSGRRGHAGTE